MQAITKNPLLNLLPLAISKWLIQPHLHIRRDTTLSLSNKGPPEIAAPSPAALRAGSGKNLLLHGV
jgi:hypothetical protein